MLVAADEIGKLRQQVTDAGRKKRKLERIALSEEKALEALAQELAQSKLTESEEASEAGVLEQLQLQAAKLPAKLQGPLARIAQPCEPASTARAGLPCCAGIMLVLPARHR